MRPFLLCCAVAAFAGCAGGEQQEAAQEAATLALADVAGKWSVAAMPEGSDSVLITTEVNATATTEGWTQVLPGRDPFPLHVVVGGDSVVTHAGPYESVLRPGVMVTTENVMRLVNGMLEGHTVAHYSGEGVGADSVLRVRTLGRRVP
jgi:hypothetical protein